MKHLILSLLFIISIFSASAFPQCTEGNCENGQGTYKYSNGDKYKGEWKNNRCDGQGTLTYLDGSNYVGQWKNHQRHGQGTYIYSDGSKYIGQFKDNQRHGQGTYIFPDGSKYVGQWKNNSYIKNPKGNETHKTLPKKMAEEKSQKAVSSKASEKTTIKRYHTVRNGETLYSISRRHNLTVQKIRRLNNLNSSVIHPGQKLLLTL
jgi:LysM repeat protein